MMRKANKPLIRSVLNQVRQFHAKPMSFMKAVHPEEVTKDTETSRTPTPTVEFVTPAEDGATVASTNVSFYHIEAS